MTNGKIGVTTENIFPVIKKFLYSDHEIFLRELVSNAVDATQKLKALASRGEMQGELGDLTIRIAVDTDKRLLTITPAPKPTRALSRPPASAAWIITARTATMSSRWSTASMAAPLPP